MLYFIPDAAFLIQSPLAPDAYLKRLRLQVEPTQRWRFTGTHEADFEGEVTADGFVLRRLKWLSSKSVASIMGKVDLAPDGGSLIHVEMQIPKSRYLQLLFSVGLLAFLRREALLDPERRPQALVTLALYIGLTFSFVLIGFNIDVAKTTRILQDIGPKPIYASI